jgi:predicted NBD/HSP70 family sugar kinase
MARLTAATRPDDIRRHNLAVMLSHIHRDGALTRAELTARLGVSRSTVGALVADLTQLGLVEEVVPTGGVGVGRPSHVVGPPSGGPFAVAVDIDVTHLTVAAVGLGGHVITAETLAMRGDHVRPDDVAGQLAEAIRRLRRSLGAAAFPIGVGVSVPGTVDRSTGRIGVAPNLGWRDVHLGNALRGSLPAGLPVLVGNDSDLAVLAEHVRGNARGIDDVVYLMGRIGVGAGIISNGVALAGHDGHAGEIGHNVIDPTGPKCRCGKRGCVETYIGDGALLLQAGRPGPVSDEAADAVFDDAQAGDEVALTAVRAIAESLGRVLAGLVNIVSPQRVLLGGSLARVLDIARRPIEESLTRYMFEAPTRTVELVQPALGRESALLGAAEIAFAPLLTDPLSAIGR